MKQMTEHLQYETAETQNKTETGEAQRPVTGAIISVQLMDVKMIRKCEFACSSTRMKHSPERQKCY
jgi:hypothetical protein